MVKVALEVTLDPHRRLTDEEFFRLEIDLVRLELSVRSADPRDRSVELGADVVSKRLVYARRAYRVLPVEDLLADPAASFWLKHALETALSRDPVDAASEADLLAAVLEARVREKLEADLARFGQV